VLNVTHQRTINSSATSVGINPGLYILIIAGFLLYALLAMVLSKTATINVGLCENSRCGTKESHSRYVDARVAVVASFYFAVVADQVSLFFVVWRYFLAL